MLHLTIAIPLYGCLTQTLLWSMIVMGVSLIGCGITMSSAVFFMYWCLTSLGYSTIYGAISSIIRDYFSPSEWSVQLGLSVTSSRLGAIFSSALFGIILQRIWNIDSIGLSVLIS